MDNILLKLFILTFVILATNVPATASRRKSKASSQRKSNLPVDEGAGFPPGWTWETQGQGKCTKASRGELSLEKAISEGNAYLIKELFVDAADCYLTAAKLSSGNPVPYTNLGLALTKQGHHKQALELCEYQVEQFPDSQHAHYCIGICQLSLGNDAAIQSLIRARDLGMQPQAVGAGLAVAYSTTAKKLLNMGQLPEALAAADKAIQEDPQGGQYTAHKTHGLILRHMGHHHEAIQSFQIAIQKNPRDAESRANLGLALNHVGRPDEALLQYTAALEIAPGFSEAMVEMGKIHQQGGRSQQAVQLYERALATSPDNVAARVALLHCRTDACDWKGREASARAVIAHMKAQAARGARPNLTPFDALVMTRASGNEMLLLARAYATRAEAEMAAAGLPPFQPPPPRSGPSAARSRLRVGYFSSDWGDHPVGRLMASVPRWHRRRGDGRQKPPAGVDCVLYALNNDDGSSYFKQVAEHATSVQAIGHLPHNQMAEKIKAGGVQVLVDLMGYTSGFAALSREYVVAQKPAPLVVNMLGYPGTSGSRHVDYVVADKVVLPPSMAHTFSEKVVYMPGSYQVNDPRVTVSSKKMAAASLGPPSEAARAELLRAEGLPPDKFIFAHFNTLRKVDTEVFDVWMNILRRVPDAVLWLLEMPPAAAPNLANEAASRGIAPSRIIFGLAKSAAQHMQRCVLADLFLDSFTYNAHTTATDALWAGVPIITLPGAMFQARVAASLVSSAGMPELITRSMKEYEDYAVRLATST